LTSLLYSFCKCRQGSLKEKKKKRYFFFKPFFFLVTFQEKTSVGEGKSRLAVFVVENPAEMFVHFGRAPFRSEDLVDPRD
jgi:hypothetical protein